MLFLMTTLPLIYLLLLYTLNWQGELKGDLVLDASIIYMLTGIFLVLGLANFPILNYVKRTISWSFNW